MAWDEDGDCDACGGIGELDCLLCDRDDPDRGTPCIDCADTLSVDCPECSGFGTYANVVAAGYG